MSCSGVYLYYGYKIKEYELKDLMEENYKNYCRTHYDDMCNKINVYDSSKKYPIYKYKFDEFLFSEYLDKLFVQAGFIWITAATLPCCAYKKGGYWIVGKKIAHIDGCNFSEVEILSKDELKQLNPLLEKGMTDIGLNKVTNNIIPNIYSIIDDCVRCT